MTNAAAIAIVLTARDLVGRKALIQSDMGLVTETECYHIHETNDDLLDAMIILAEAADCSFEVGPADLNSGWRDLVLFWPTAA